MIHQDPQNGNPAEKDHSDAETAQIGVYPAARYLAQKVGYLPRAIGGDAEKAVRENRPLGALLRGIRAPDHPDLYTKLRHLAATDEIAYDALRKKSPGFTPASGWKHTPGPRRLNPKPVRGGPATTYPTNTPLPSGVAPVDIDIALDGVDLDALKRQVAADPHVLSVFLSGSGRALCAMVAVSAPGEALAAGVYKARLTAWAEQICPGHVNVDGKNGQTDYSRLRFGTMDPDIFVRDGTVRVWTNEGETRATAAPDGLVKRKEKRERGRPAYLDIPWNALRKAQDELRSAPSGTRHNAIRSAAFTQAGYALWEGAPQMPEAEAALVGAIVSAGHPETDARRTFNDSWKAGLTMPFDEEAHKRRAEEKRAKRDQSKRKQEAAKDPENVHRGIQDVDVSSYVRVRTTGNILVQRDDPSDRPYELPTGKWTEKVYADQPDKLHPLILTGKELNPSLSLAKAKLLAHPDLVAVDERTFHPGKPYGVSGKVWNDCALPDVTPVANDALAWEWEHVLQHLVPDERERWIVRYWCAHVVLYPARKVRWALVLYGPPGTGKNTLLVPIRGLLGEWNVMQDDMSKLHGSHFTGDLERSLLLYLEESKEVGKFRGDTLEKIKTVITDYEIPAERKYENRRFVDSFHDVVILSNQPEPIRVEAGDRRIASVATTTAKIPPLIGQELTERETGLFRKSEFLAALKAYFQRIENEIGLARIGESCGCLGSAPVTESKAELYRQTGSRVAHALETIMDAAPDSEWADSAVYRYMQTAHVSVVELASAIAYDTKEREATRDPGGKETIVPRTLSVLAHADTKDLGKALARIFGPAKRMPRAEAGDAGRGKYYDTSQRQATEFAPLGAGELPDVPLDARFCDWSRCGHAAGHGAYPAPNKAGHGGHGKKREKAAYMRASEDTRTPEKTRTRNESFSGFHCDQRDQPITASNSTVTAPCPDEVHRDQPAPADCLHLFVDSAYRLPFAPPDLQHTPPPDRYRDDGLIACGRCGRGRAADDPTCWKCGPAPGS